MRWIFMFLHLWLVFTALTFINEEVKQISTELKGKKKYWLEPDEEEKKGKSLNHRLFPCKQYEQSWMYSWISKCSRWFLSSLLHKSLVSQSCEPLQWAWGWYQCKLKNYIYMQCDLCSSLWVLAAVLKFLFVWFQPVILVLVWRRRRRGGGHGGGLL